ncbi:halocin C8-like domain-containing protein [Glycomyces tarimensis]
MKRLLLCVTAIVGLLGIGASAQADPQEPNAPEPPDSTGSSHQQIEAKDTVADSAAFARQQEVADAPFDFEQAVVNVKSDYASVAVNSLDPEHSRVSLYFVDLAADRVLWDRTMVFTPAADRGADSNAVDIAVLDEGEPVYEGTVGADGELSAAPEYRELTTAANGAATGTADAECAEAAQALAAGDDVSQQGVCEWAVGALCATGGGAGCYGACVALGLVSGPGGLGCATVCSLIAFLGCQAATETICG